MTSLLRGHDAATACHRLVDTANQRGTLDNLTAAVLRVVVGPERRAASDGLGARIRGLFGRRGG
jgi:serine/threonine protein phosphatase PrpC